MSTDSPAAATRPPAAGAAERLTPLAVALALLVGAMVVLAFATLAFAHAVVAAFVAGVLVVLSAIDIERGIIPNRIVLPAAALALAAQLALFPGRALDWTLAPILAALLLFIPQLLRRSWMGMGDVKLALLLGVGLGWGVFSALILAFLCVFPVALLVLIRGGAAARKTAIPFGPFLSVGALIVLFGPHLAGLPAS